MTEVDEDTSDPSADDAAVDDEIGVIAHLVERSFDEWYRSEFSSVVGLVYGLTGSRTGAEEIAQDAFLAAHRRWGQVSGYDDPGAWVRRVAVNRSRSAFRRKLAEARALARYAGRTRELPEELPPDADTFWAAVRSLPGRQAEVVALHYVDDRSVDQIAEVLGISAGSVKTHLHRARHTLAERLQLRETNE